MMCGFLVHSTKLALTSGRRVRNVTALGLLVGLLSASGAWAQGFFGGIKFTDTTRDQTLLGNSAESPSRAGVGIKVPSSFANANRLPNTLVPEWERTRNPFLTEQNAIFGGVRFGSGGSGVGLGAAMSTVRPSMDASLVSISQGLSYQTNLPWLNPVHNPGNLNLDVYSSYTTQNKFTFFSRLGYERNETRALQGLEANMIAPIASRGLRQGQSLNYGLGIRYEVSDNFGLRAEYTRGTRLGLERNDLLKDTEPDSVSVGVRFKF
ncbi:MAG: hypothetical protein RLZZ502_1313 [Pseudomonadota bacterium]|jgi:opacity protein-like surface antigen